MTSDPVCGMEIRTGPTAWLFGLAHPRVEQKPIRIEREDRRFVFCSNACLKEFEADPGRFGAV